MTIQAPFTLEAWVNPSSTAYGLALGEGGGTGLNGSANFGGWQMGLGSSGGNNKFQMQYYTGIGSAANNGVASAPFLHAWASGIIMSSRTTARLQHCM